MLNISDENLFEKLQEIRIKSEDVVDKNIAKDLINIWLRLKYLNETNLLYYANYFIKVVLGRVEILNISSAWGFEPTAEIFYETVNRIKSLYNKLDKDI